MKLMGTGYQKKARQAQKLVNNLLEQGLEKSDVYLISPFRDVVSGLSKLFKTDKDIKVGTIHTVQGKEARAVLLK